VENYQENYGLNEIGHSDENKWYRRLLDACFDPFSLVLLLLAAVSFVTGEVPAGLVILAMVFFSIIVKYIQENKSSQASEKLRAMIKTTAATLRDSKKCEIPIAELVVGDVIFLAAGDIIPADARILKSKDFFVGQSSLTGESEPTEKFSVLGEEISKKDSPSPLELNNLCFMGTNVVSGSATAIIVKIGADTCFGNLAKSTTKKRAETSFDKGLKSTSVLLIQFMAIMVAVVFLINGLVKNDWLNAFLFAISIAVGLTPEMLPTIVTVNLAKGAINMSRKKTIVKNLNSIQNFGAMDILCTDKTGTLTEDRIVLQYHLNFNGEEDQRVLRHAYLNSQFQTGLKNLLDLAVIEKGVEKGFFELNSKYTKIDELPFDFARRRMSVMLEDKNGKKQLITKGAVEEMISICGFVEIDGQVTPLTNDLKKMIFNAIEKLNAEGMRVIALAQKNFLTEKYFSMEEEKNMVLIGYLSFLDPPKQSSRSAIEALKNVGVKVKVLTGDSDRVSKFVCKKVGIESDGILLGSDVENMDNETLSQNVEKYDIFAKLTPSQKSRIVTSLRERGHTVGYMGDGINDAPAMMAADVGISVDTAVDIAKESADIVLLKKDLIVLKDGVIEGRRIFGNIIKYIKMTASSNFGNMFSVLFASVFVPYLPMLPIQILVLNLLYDFSQTTIPWDNVDQDFLQTQKKWDTNSIKTFMLWLGPISSIFDIATFLIMLYAFGCRDVANPRSQALFHTAWFIESLMTQTLVIHLIRTKKIPFVESWASLPVCFSTILLAGVGALLPFTKVGRILSMAPLPPAFLGVIILIIALYFISAQAVKKIYIKKYGFWL
jgi:Mg2+-importing ATPase